MTYRERWVAEHPGEKFRYTVATCPFCCGYSSEESDELFCKNHGCSACWDREIPENAASEGLTAGLNTVIPEIALAAEKAAKSTLSMTEALGAVIPTPSIKDSGDRTEFKTGAVRDMREGKGRCDLMPLEVVGIASGQPIILKMKMFLDSMDTSHLYACLNDFAAVYDDGETKASAKYIGDTRYCTMFLEVAKHFEEGAKKYGENNWQKGIPVHCYIDSAIRHYLKWLRGDKDEPHDRAFVWNIMCCIWEVDCHKEDST